MALALALGCAAAAPPSTPAAAPGLADGGAVYLDESEVDVPARPMAPIRPEYPLVARSRGLEGDVTLLVHVRADGRVVRVRELASDADVFARAAVAAVRETPFVPGRRHRHPVDSTVTIRVRFRLEGESGMRSLPPHRSAG